MAAYVIGKLVLAANWSTFRATDVLHSNAIAGFSDASSHINLRQIYSAISKFEPPVSASIPLRPFRLVFRGRLLLSSVPSSALVIQGGLPITRSGPVSVHPIS